MGLSITATYGIIFTASLMMFGIMLNSLLYAYDQFNSGLGDRMEMIDAHQNSIEVERVVYNSSRIEIIARNGGPYTVSMDKANVIVNGTPLTFDSPPYWYPGMDVRIFVNSSYDIGGEHGVQFCIPFPGAIATSEYDKIYAINDTSLVAYDYRGVVVWRVTVGEPRDVSVGSYVFFLNSSGIFSYDYDGTQVGFFPLSGLSSLDSRGPTVYAISSNRLFIVNFTTLQVRTVGISSGRDVAVGHRVYVLENGAIRIFDYSGNSLGVISDSRLAYATRISADWNIAGDYLFALTSDGNVLVYRDGGFVGSIPLERSAGNIDVYGKIYLSGECVDAVNMGYRIKIVDEFGNEAYGLL